MRPGKQTIDSRQISAINNRSLFIRDSHDLSAINSRWNRLNSATPVIPESTSSCSSSCENNTFDIPKRKRVTFSLNPSLTIHEHGDTDSNDVIGECVVINSKSSY